MNPNQQPFDPLVECDKGRLHVTGKDTALSLDCHRACVWKNKGGDLVLAGSIVGDGSEIKALRGALNGGAKVKLAVKGSIADPDRLAEINQTDRYFSGFDFDYLSPSEFGYRMSIERLDYRAGYVVFVAKRPGFMPAYSHEALWRELQSSRFTTPILRSWVPYLETQLRSQDLLVELTNWKCNCGLLLARDSNLDEIVSQGLQDGAITIPTSNGEAA